MNRTARSTDKIIRFYFTGPCTRAKLIKLTGLAPATICRWFAANETHIADWTLVNNQYVAMYELGKGSDVPKPVRIAPYQRYRMKKHMLRTATSPWGQLLKDVV